MSSVLKKKKKALRSKWCQDVEEYGKSKKRAHDTRSCFNTVFASLQLCAWYVLYAPEFFDWEYERLKEFSQFIEQNNERYGENTDAYREIQENLSQEIRINIKEEAAAFPIRLKLKMYGRPVKNEDAISVVNCMNAAIECGLFLILHTLYTDFGMTSGEISGRFLPQLKCISGEYAHGLTNDTLLKYFVDIEKFDVDIEKEVLYD